MADVSRIFFFSEIGGEGQGGGVRAGGQGGGLVLNENREGWVTGGVSEEEAWRAVERREGNVCGGGGG